LASYVRAPQRRHQRFAGAPEFGERASPQPGPCAVCPPPRVTDPAQTVDAAAGRKPDDERADLPGLRGSLIIPFPPARAATPAPRSRHAGCRDPAAADMFDFRPVSGGGVQFRRRLGRCAVYRAVSLRTRRPRSRADPRRPPRCRAPKLLRAMILRPCEGTHRDASIKQQSSHPAARRTRPAARGARDQQEHYSASRRLAQQGYNK